MCKTLRWWLRGGMLACAFLPSLLLAAEPKPAGNAKQVELFDGIKSKAIDVKFVAKDETQARVSIKNVSKEPLSVTLPEVFAAVPVLAQRGFVVPPLGPFAPNVGPFAPNMDMFPQQFNPLVNQQPFQQPFPLQQNPFPNRNPNLPNNRNPNPIGQPLVNNPNQNQGVGGNMNNQQRQRNGLFNIAPEKVAQFTVQTVCLEYGKKEPRAAVKYEIRPLDQVTAQPGVRELLSSMGQQNFPQEVAQAAAWHLASNLSWAEMAALQYHADDGTTESWFSFEELAAARQLADKAITAARQPAPRPAVQAQLSVERGSTEHPTQIAR